MGPGRLPPPPPLGYWGTPVHSQYTICTPHVHLMKTKFTTNYTIFIHAQNVYTTFTPNVQQMDNTGTTLVHYKSYKTHIKHM